LQELGSNSPGFLELESHKKWNAKRNAQPSCAAWLHYSTILGLAAVGEAAEMMENMLKNP
jgi:hypothetical protein